MRELSGNSFSCNKIKAAESGGVEMFSVLGRRFAYEPDGMRLCELGYYDDVPEFGQTVVPQFELPVVQPRMMVLVPTLHCNLDCRYCFATSGEECMQNRELVMDEDTLNKALEMMPVGRKVTLCFFGGEPLLAWDKIVRAVKVAGDRFIKPQFSLTTNGTLLDDARVEWLARHDFSLIVSIDGPAWLHDSARPDKKGLGTYHRVLEGLEWIAKYPSLASRTTLRATFDGGDGHAHLLTRLVHLNELCSRYGLGNVSVEPADLSEGCGRGGIAVAPSEALYEEYLDAAEWFARELKAGNKPKFHHFSIRMQRIENRKPAPSECGAGVGYVTVSPSGELHACHRLGAVIGDVEQGIDRRLQQPWCDNRYYARHFCPDCWARNLCGGGCRINSVNHCGDIRKPDSLGCWLTQTCIKCAAWILAETKTRKIGDIANSAISSTDKPETPQNQAG